jgi:hypothetical protein
MSVSWAPRCSFWESLLCSHTSGSSRNSVTLDLMCKLDCHCGIFYVMTACQLRDGARQLLDGSGLVIICDVCISAILLGLMTTGCNV